MRRFDVEETVKANAGYLNASAHAHFLIPETCSFSLYFDAQETFCFKNHDRAEYHEYTASINQIRIIHYI